MSLGGTRLLLSAAVFVGFGVACGSLILVGSDSIGGSDAAVAIDTGAPSTAGAATETNVPSDAGTPIDAGTSGDADATGAANAPLDASTGAIEESGDDSGLPALVVPWSAGFEDGFVAWGEDGQGFCYALSGAGYEIVPYPVHSGIYAAAFGIDALADASPPSQARCVRQGALPQSATYGAWFYVPTAIPSVESWNLFHFQGANVPDGTFAHGLWDVSLNSQSDGGMHAFGYDYLSTTSLEASAPPMIPIGTWFHLEVFLRRAADASGEFTLYQDGQVVVDVSGIETDDSTWGQWYVGSSASSLTPPTAVVYVDDVTIDPSP